MRRSAASISVNLAEGLYRSGKKELLRFLFQSKASCAETIYHLIRAKDLKYSQKY
jgi:four helix bundle protein